ncbi:MAG: patatin-like phospholipase family protein [Deltaproteobacteria bacterium]|nr:patatin-like phospholipase family protein [Deltaproteobacteria bacterium]
MSESRRSIRALATTPISIAPRPSKRPRVALVLSGGGARGAYEAGVLRYICEELPLERGVRPWFDVVCGTSVGALNACYVAATADVLDRSAALLWARWLELRADSLLRLRPLDAFRLVRSMLGGPPMQIERTPDESGRRHGGIIDTSELERFVLHSVPWSRIRRNVESGALEALSVSATHVTSGKTVVFVDSARPLPPWSRDPHVMPLHTRIGPFHALASAAIPVLFPPIALDGSWYVDGGLRQNTPLSPAIRLGADRVLVVSLRHRRPHGFNPEPTVDVSAVPSPFFLAGKALNALLIDRIDYDLDRLRHMNAIIDAGVEMTGPEFVARLNERLSVRTGTPVRHVRDMLVRPSQDLGALASEYAKSERFAARAGVTAHGFRRLAERDAGDDSDLLSYLLFDGDFSKQLLELGRDDARARRDELAALFTE